MNDKKPVWDEIDEQASREGDAKTRHSQYHGYSDYGRGRRLFNTHRLGRNRPVCPPTGSRLHDRDRDAA